MTDSICHSPPPPGLPHPLPTHPQIRQLLFPDTVEGGARVFKVPNPDYERGIAEDWQPRPLRFLNMELHGIWGKGVPGALKVRGRGGGSSRVWR